MECETTEQYNIGFVPDPATLEPMEDEPFEEPTDAEMREALLALEDSEDEDDEVDEDGPPPPPPPLVRQHATAPIVRQGITLREQEIRFIEEHGLVAFCHGTIVTAVLQDAEYLRAQLTYLRR